MTEIRIPRKIDHVQGYIHGFNAALRMKSPDDADEHIEAVCAIARELPRVQKAEPPRYTPREHRLQATYPALWKAVDGAIRAAQHAHQNIQISARLRSSIVKRAVGQVLALGAGSGQPDDSDAANPLSGVSPVNCWTGQPPADSDYPQGASQ